MRFALDRDAIALLIAESGCGKTTALGHFVRDLDATAYHVVYSSMSSLKAFGLLSYLGTKAGLRARRFKGETAHELVTHCRGLAKRSLIIIDDAHLVPDDALENLRLLTGDSLDQKSPFALVLAGQPLLRERLAEPVHYALAQRIAVRARLRPLTDSEITLFLDKHLRAAGAKCTCSSPTPSPSCSSTAVAFRASRRISPSGPCSPPQPPTRKSSTPTPCSRRCSTRRPREGSRSAAV